MRYFEVSVVTYFGHRFTNSLSPYQISRMQGFSRGIEEIFESDGIKSTDNVSPQLPRILNEDIITSNVVPAHAFEVFCGKSYFTFQQNLFTHDIRQLELPWQKVARIKLELSDILDQIKLNQNDALDSEAAIWSVLDRETRRLSEITSGLEKHPNSKLVQAGSLSIDSICKALSESRLDTAESEIRLSETPADMSNIIQLHDRILSLESILGGNLNVIDIETTIGISSAIRSSPTILVASNASVLETVNTLDHKLNLIDVASLDVIKGKVAALRLELDTVTKSRASTDSKVIEAYKNIEDIYGILKKVEALSDELPRLILHLRTVETAHNSMINISTRLVTLEDNIGKLFSELKANDELLSTLRDTLEENLKIMKSNIERVDDTFKKFC